MEQHSSLASLTDRQLVTALTTLAAFERAAIAKLVAALAEFDSRRLYLPLGFTSLFAYCTNRLGLSQDEAFWRIEAARVARRFPAVLDYLERGAVTLTTVKLLGPHLTPGNHAQLLQTASHQKKPEIELLVARLRPKPDVPSTIRKLPPLSTPRTEARPLHDASGSGRSPNDIGQQTPAVGGRSASAIFDLPPGMRGPDPHAAPTSHSDAVNHLLHSESRASASVPSRRPVVEPLSDASYRLQITISRASHDTLREIQALMRHSVPDGDPAVIVQRALDLLVADLRKKRRALVVRPREKPVAGTHTNRPTVQGGRHIPAHVKRRVWERDAGCCAFVGLGGMRCSEKGFLEYHHVKPHAKGGAASAANIQLRCRAHNAYEGELVFGARR